MLSIHQVDCHGAHFTGVRLVCAPIAAMAVEPSITAMEMAPVALYYVMEMSEDIEQRWQRTNCMPADVGYANVDDASKTGRPYWGLRQARKRSNNE